MIDKKAFTLIELLVVVAIIGILAAVGVVAYNGYTKAAKVNVTIQNHSTVVNSIQSILSLCELGEPVSYVNKNSYTVNIPCDHSLGMESPIINKHAGFQQGGKWWYGFQNPYNTDLVGVKESVLSYSGAKDYNKSYKPLGSSGNICCITLGTVTVQRVSITDANSGKFNCKGSCCFAITTAYDVDSNDIAKVKIDTVSGDSCTR
jgi:prepilin-type N-terminal cleavage/methylation domain-containing protein